MPSELTVQIFSASWRQPSGCLSEGFLQGSEIHRRPMASRGGFPVPVWCGCKEGSGCWTRPSPTAHSLWRGDVSWKGGTLKLLTLRCIVIQHPSTECASGRNHCNISISPKERDMTPIFISKKFMESPSHLFIHVEFWTWVTVLMMMTKPYTDWVSWSRETDRFSHVCHIKIIWEICLGLLPMKIPPPYPDSTST